MTYRLIIPVGQSVEKIEIIIPFLVENRTHVTIGDKNQWRLKSFLTLQNTIAHFSTRMAKTTLTSRRTDDIFCYDLNQYTFRDYFHFCCLLRLSMITYHALNHLFRNSMTSIPVNVDICDDKCNLERDRILKLTLKMATIDYGP